MNISVMKNFRDLPEEIQNMMLNHQEEQGNEKDTEIFEKDLLSDRYMGGFNWDETVEGHRFWNDLLID